MRPLLLACLLVALPSVAWAAPDFAALEKTFKSEFQSKKYDDRLKSFEAWKDVRDPQAIDVLMWAANALVAEQEAQKKSEEDAETGLEATLSKIEAANQTLLDKGSGLTSKDLDAFNKRMGKLEGVRDGWYSRQRGLTTQRARLRALADASTMALGALGTHLVPADLPALLDKVEAAWAGANSSPADRLRAVDVLSRIRQAPVADRLRVYATNEVEEARVRSVALSARIDRVDPGALEDAIAAIASKAPWEVKAEAIDGLRRLHRREGIEPLIAFLGMEGIGRLREDATRALRSLTAQGHGPYKEPWQAWWDGAKAAFEMPPKPADAASAPADAGVTFYGIRTFSDKILIVLDVSGSMLEPVDVTKQRPDPTKIAVAKKELVATIDMLDEKMVFNLVFFNHSITRYKAGMIPADKASRDQAKRFVADYQPAGGTNIHDALETAFHLAGGATDAKSSASLIDTVFFLTDGTPTAGKVQEPKMILEAVAEWNKSAHITIHCVGVGGDCDEAFLKALSAQTGGQYVKR